MIRDPARRFSQSSPPPRFLANFEIPASSNDPQRVRVLAQTDALDPRVRRFPLSLILAGATVRMRFFAIQFNSTLSLRLLIFFQARRFGSWSVHSAELLFGDATWNAPESQGKKDKENTCVCRSDRYETDRRRVTR